MLVKVGTYRINLAHVARAYHNEGGMLYVDFVGGSSCHFAHQYADQFVAAWDEWAADQTNLKAQAKNLEEQAEKFAAETKRVQEYEKQLRAEAQAAGLGQNKSGIITPGMMIPRRGRG